MEYLLIFVLVTLTIGFIAFSLYEQVMRYKEDKNDSTKGGKLPDIETSIVDLIALSMRADGVVSKAELAQVKRFFLKGFGEERAHSLLVKLRDTLKNKHITDIRRQCVQINQSLNYRQKLALENLFLAIASVEPLQKSEVQFIKLFAKYTRITVDDLNDLRCRYFNDSMWNIFAEDRKTEAPHANESNDEAYKVLGLTVDADMSQVKRAYRKLVMQWHPDRFSSKSVEEVAMASAKFREINQAYKTICGTA